MIGLAMAAALAAHPAVDAEREFAARAQKAGQWTAFRETAAPDAIMFVPDAVSAQTWLADRKDPPRAVQWWPSQALVSCDGKVAVTTGSWLRSTQKLVGYFTTVWTEQAGGGWKWQLDHADTLAKPRAVKEPAAQRRASCRNRPEASAGQALTVGKGKWGAGLSPDRSLIWKWEAGEKGARTVRVWLWDGRGYVSALEDRMAGE